MKELQLCSVFLSLGLRLKYQKVASDWLRKVMCLPLSQSLYVAREIGPGLGPMLHIFFSLGVGGGEKEEGFPKEIKVLRGHERIQGNTCLLHLPISQSMIQSFLLSPPCLLPHNLIKMVFGRESIITKQETLCKNNILEN